MVRRHYSKDPSRANRFASIRHRRVPAQLPSHDSPLQVRRDSRLRQRMCHLLESAATGNVLSTSGLTRNPAISIIHYSSPAGQFVTSPPLPSLRPSVKSNPTQPRRPRQVAVRGSLQDCMLARVQPRVDQDSIPRRRVLAADRNYRSTRSIVVAAASSLVRADTNSQALGTH